MTRDELQTASEHLRTAAETATGDLRERILRQADQLSDLAEADRGPDHGRLARHMNALSEIADAADDGVEPHVRSAREAVSSYREGVPGV